MSPAVVVDFAAREIEGLLRPGLLGGLRLIVEHIAAIDHQAGDLQHGKAEDRDQDDRNDANVTEGFHAARPSDLLRSENACAAAAIALAVDTLGARAPAQAPVRGRPCGDRDAATAGE